MWVHKNDNTNGTSSSAEKSSAPILLHAVTTLTIFPCLCAQLGNGEHKAWGGTQNRKDGDLQIRATNEPVEYRTRQQVARDAGVKHKVDLGVEHQTVVQRLNVHHDAVLGDTTCKSRRGGGSGAMESEEQHANKANKHTEHKTKSPS